MTAHARGRRVRAGGFLAVFITTFPAAVAAQPSNIGGRLFAEVGRAVGSSDAHERQTSLPADVTSARLDSDFVWSISGGAMPWRHWGIGFEWRAPADVTSRGGRAINSFSEVDHERGTFALAIARPGRWPLGAIELIAGPGLVRQHVSQTVETCLAPAGCTGGANLSSRTFAAVTTGVNAIVKVGPHIGLVGFARYTSTRRSLLPDAGNAVNAHATLIGTFIAGIAIRGWL
jgi:hypothetical protein